MTAYYCFFEGIFARSPGKWICGTRVVDLEGNRPSFLQVIGRSLARFIPFEAFSFLGSRGIGWHDSLSSTRVVRTRGSGTLSLEDSQK